MWFIGRCKKSHDKEDIIELQQLFIHKNVFFCFGYIESASTWLRKGERGLAGDQTPDINITCKSKRLGFFIGLRRHMILFV